MTTKVDPLELLKGLDLADIEGRIAELKEELRQLQGLYKLTGGTAPPEGEPATKKAGRRRSPGSILERLSRWLPEHGPARNSEIAAALGVGSGGVSTVLTHNPKLFKKGADGLWRAK